MRIGMARVAAAVALAACGAEAPAKTADGGDSSFAPQAVMSPGAGSEVCRVAQAPRPLPADLHESSGVAASRAHPGVFWTHNDSGDPVVYAVDASGALAGRVRLSGAEVEDWEDVSVAPCPGGGSCLYLADIGDNDARRSGVTVWRVPEPAPGDAETRPAEAIRLRYPDGAHDAEAMFVLADGTVHVLTKGETGPIALYRAPAAAPSGEAVMEKVRELSAGEVKRDERVTGADVSPDGAWVAVRTLRDVAFHPLRALVGGGGGPARRMDLGALDEAQGEGVAFTPDGALLLTSEGGKKDEPGTFARLSCAL